MRRRTLVAASVALVLAAIGVVYVAKRTVRWNDARTMPPPLEAAVRAYAKGDSAAGLQSVRLLLHRYRAPAWEARARILAATHLARDGRDAEIVDVLPKDLAPADPLAAHGTLLRARGWLARGAPERAADLARQAAAVPGFPAADEARLVDAQALQAQGKWKEAIAALDASSEAAAAVAAARIAKTHGDGEGARRRLAAALIRAGADSDVDRVSDVIDELEPDPSLRFSSSERPRVASRAQAFLEDGHAKTAVDLLRLARPAGPPSAATGAEALIEAEALLKLGRIAEMGAPLARARQAGAEFVDGARYLDARRAAAVGSFGAYRAGLETLGRQGKAPWRERALLDLARAGEGAPSSRTVDAYRRYRAAAGAAADPLALLREAWASYDLGRTADADAGFARALARADAPDGVKVTATYWRARIADVAGQAAAARSGYGRAADAYPNHYYGALAAKRLGRALPDAPSASPPPDPAAVGRAGRWLSAGRAFVSVGLWDEAGPCYRVVARSAGTESGAVAAEAAAAAVRAAAVSDAIGFAQDAVGDRDRTAATAVPRELWRLLYPASAAEALTRSAAAFGLDPNLVAGVAFQESAFNPLAVSAAGARGLLQVMPAVGAELARAAGIARFDPADLFDPATNLKLGCAHLADYRRRFGSVPRALAAYNGGPSRVERWTVPGGRDDDERFVERIPIPETRIYVKRVLAGARMYQIAWPKGLGVD